MDHLPWKAGWSCVSVTLMVQSVMTSGMNWRQQLCAHSLDLPLKVCDYYISIVLTFEQLPPIEFSSLYLTVIVLYQFV